MIADDSADPTIVASDLVGQAEHGHESPAWLFTTTGRPRQAMTRVPDLIAHLPPTARAPPAAAWRDYGEVIVCDTPRGGGRGLATATPPSIWRCMPPRPRLVARAPHLLRLAVPRRRDHGGLRRQGLRPQPRAADQGRGALFGRPVGAQVHEDAHLAAHDARSRRDIGAVTARISRLEGMEAHARTADDRACQVLSRSAFLPRPTK